MKRLLIITTITDLSIPLFLENKISKLLYIDFCFFHEDITVIKQNLKSTKFDFVYIKDPFTDQYDDKDIKNKVDYIIKNFNGYIIDNIDSMEDVYFEDKLLQYNFFSHFMPKTKIFSKNENEFDSNYIIKKRLSSRGKGIIFDKKDVSTGDNNYIIQEKINIEREYRVYVIFNKIFPIVSVKSSKTETTKIKVLNTENINKDLKNFVKKIIIDNKFDLIGLDIAFFNGKYYLIEVNRSPQFTAFYRKTKKNLGEIFVKELLKKEAYHDE